MALISTAELMSALEVVDRSQANVGRYDLLRRLTEAAVKTYIKWDPEAAEATEYYDGNGMPTIILRRPYVSAVAGVWADATGAYGAGDDPFPDPESKLTDGGDYVLRKEGVYGKSGLLERMANSAYLFPSDLAAYPGRGGLAYRKGAYWPAGVGNIKVTYTAGFVVAPDDLKLAVISAVGIVRSTSKYGWPVTSESLGDYSYSLAIAREPEFGSVRQVLSTFRDTPL